MMSYRGEVSYQQRGPPERDNYYYGGNKNYGGPPQQDQYQRMNDPGPPGGRYQDYDRRQDNQSGQPSDQYRNPQPQNHQQVGGFSDYRDNRPPTHRYPETFQRNDQQPPPREPSRERYTDPNKPTQNWSSEPKRDSRPTAYGREPYQGPKDSNYQERGRSRSPVVQDDRIRNYTNQGQNYAGYGDGRPYEQHGGGIQSRVDQSQPHRPNRPNDQPISPGWRDQNVDRNYAPLQDDRRQEPPRVRPVDNYHQNEPRRERVPTSSGWNQTPKPTSNDYSQPYTQQRDVPSYNQPEPPPPQRQYQDEYRDANYRQEVQSVPIPQPEPPHLVAKTSGSSAVFGIVARVDTSPTRQNAPVTSPVRTNAPPVLPSQTRDYTPSYDQYRDREQPPPQTTQQPHQYHHALTPISEKPSPPSSISSRGHPPEPSWSIKQPAEGQNQYRPPEDTGQSWHGKPERGYQDQHQQQVRPSYNQSQIQYQDRQPPSQGFRPGYREYDYTESSGYGSESTHYTERSYNSEQQRLPDKGQYDSRLPPPQQQPNDDWSGRSPTGSYGRSPPTRQETDTFREQYPGDGLRSPSQVSQQFDRRDDNQQRSQYRPQDSYGAPVSVQGQRQYDDRRPPPQDDRYGPQDYSRGPPPHNQVRPSSPSSYTGGHFHLPNMNAESGVEQPHVKSVRAAKNMFEKQSDPRRPPPAPKPLISPKPHFGSNINTRPIPPRPRNLSDGGWDQQPPGRNQYQPPPQPHQGPKSTTSPRYDSRPQQYQPRTQPSLSQSMDNLDDRSRYQSPSSQRPPQHAQSMQNLNERSRQPAEQGYQQHDQARPYQPSQPNEGYRKSFSGPAPVEERPMVLAVKYNPDTGPSVYTRQDQQKSQGSWERPQREMDQSRQQTDYRPQSQLSPSPTYNERSSWSADPPRGGHQQSYNDNTRNTAPNQQSYNQPQTRTSLNENQNYVPDVVARSYELANQSQQPSANKQPDNINQSPYSSHPQQPGRDSDYRRQQFQNFQNAPEKRNSTDRWPTPPPPIVQEQSPAQQNISYTDDWRRPSPPAQQHPEPTFQRTQESAPPPSRQSGYPPNQQQPPSRQSGYPPSQHQPQGYLSNEPPSLQIPPPPQQPYPYDSESSEVDVDAPTPPPSAKNLRPTYMPNNVRSESPYERNKPVPVTSRNPPDSWRRLPYQQLNVREEQSSAQQSQESLYSKAKSPSYQSTAPPKSAQPSESKSPPPQKPQRNSTSMSPQLPTTSGQNGFDFDVASTQPLKYPSSRERQRLGKSGALANRKPPTRTSSSSNLLEIGNEYQIEVTDSDISAKATIEVHREESMRILRAAKKQGKDNNIPPTVLEKNDKLRASQRLISPPSDHEDEPSGSKSGGAAKQTGTKLVYKMPSAEAAKLVPMPQVTEPAAQATKRPPTYLGFGYTPEKPKTDLLTQFKSARDSALRTAAEKQDRALKSVSAMVKFSHGKKEPKSPPKQKLTPAERNAKLLDKMHVEVKGPPPEEERNRHSRHHRPHEERGHVVRSSTRSSSNVKPEIYDGDDDTTNGSRHGRDRRGRDRERNRDNERAKSRGRSTSRDRNLSPEGRGPRTRHRSKSRERSLSPEDRHRPRRDFDDRRFEERPPFHPRRRNGEDSSYHRRPPSPDHRRYRDDDRHYPRSPQHRQYPQHPQPYDRNRAAREPDWVEKYRRGRESANHPSRRAWVNDPRRVEVTVEGRRRELDMDAFERDVKRATSYNSDFEQPEPRRQMIPSKLSMKAPPNPKRQPPGDWMNALKEKNRSAARARPGVYNPAPYRRRTRGDLQHYYKFGHVSRY